MAYGYWKSGSADKESVFILHFRKPPFGSGFTIACGLAPAVELLERFRFAEDDLDYLPPPQPPFGSGFPIACGLAPAVELLERFRFAEDDLDYLATLQGNDGSPL